MLQKINKAAKITKKLRLTATLDLPREQSEKMPLVCFLHGAGERGMNDYNQVCIRNELNDRLGIALLTPVCPEDEIWQPDMIKCLVEDCLKHNKNIDPSRVYLTGFSMGGRGTWFTACEYPDMFSAIMPLSGYSIYLKANKIKDLPCWALHGGADKVVPPIESVKMVSTIREMGGKAKLSIIPNLGHSMCWVYEREEIYEWLLQHQK